MGRLKFTAERKIETIRAYQSGEISKSQLKAVYGMSPNRIYEWIAKYEIHGKAAFERGHGNAGHSQGYKPECVEAVLCGEGSVDDIVAKYNISDRAQRRKIK